MNLNDCEAIWKRQELPAGAADDLPGLRNTFEAKRRKLAATLVVRDLLETGAGLLVAAAFAGCWWKIGPAGWPIAVAIALMLGITGFFLRERLRVRRLRLGPDATLLAKIGADLAELHHQRRLLINLWSWYLGPCLAAIVIFTVAVARLIPPAVLAALWAHPVILLGLLLYFVVVLPVSFWGIWALNRRAVRKGLEPRIEELEKLQQSLLSSAS